MELLGGKLELKSERGIGSLFFFTIPLAETLAAADEIAPRVVRLPGLAPKEPTQKL